MTCVYAVGCVDGSTVVGDFIKEMMTFTGGVQVPHLSIGCGDDNKGLFGVPGTGILGLGHGQISCLSQIAALGYNATSFSYCLLDFLSSPGPTPPPSPSLPAPWRPPRQRPSPPTVWNPNMGTFYYMQFISVSVGGTRMPGVTERDL